MTTPSVRIVEQPEWLNEKFFEEIYQNREELKGKEYQLKIISCTGVVDIGDNYASTMYRVRVEMEVAGKVEEEQSYVVKALITDIPILKEASIFPNEFEAYKTIPKFEEMWSEVGQPVKFSPKCLKIVEGDQEIIVMSDLKAEGYQMQDRFKGLDMEHVQKTLTKIAKFHASSVLYKEKYGNFGPRLSRKLIEPSMEEIFAQFTDSKVKALAKHVELWKMDQKLVDKVNTWSEVFFAELKAITDPDTDPNDFLVLNHGDLWLNNQMFKYDSDNKLEEVIFVDYQVTYWGHPVCDLLYFLLSSTPPELVVANFDYFFKYYHDNLVLAMKTLGVKKRPLSLRELHIQTLKYGFYVTSLFVGIVPIVIMEKNDDAKLSNFFDDENSASVKNLEDKMFNNPKMEHKMRLLLPFFDDKGMLDSDFVKKPIKEEVAKNGTHDSQKDTNNDTTKF